MRRNKRKGAKPEFSLEAVLDIIESHECGYDCRSEYYDANGNYHSAHNGYCKHDIASNVRGIFDD